MGDTTKVIGQQEVGRCPGWRHHPWTNERSSSGTGGLSCTPWLNCARATALAGRRRANGWRGSMKRDGEDWRIEAARRTGVRTLDLPAISTAGDLLARRGLVKKRRRRRHYQHPGVVPPTTAQPNDGSCLPGWARDASAVRGRPALRPLPHDALQ